MPGFGSSSVGALFVAGVFAAELFAPAAFVQEGGRGGQLRGPQDRMLLPMRRALRIAARLLLLGAVELVILGAALPFVSADGEPEARRSQVVRAVEKVKPAVVSVRTTQVVTQRLIDWDLVIREEPTEVEGSLGSGVIFHPAGFVITNAHVILRGSNFFVHPPGQEQAQGWRALPLAVDLTNDLAILRILPQEGRPAAFPHLPLGRSNDLMLGETAIAVGNPFKLGLSVSTGVVAGVNRSLKVGRTTFNDFIQVDAAINPGNSGGPLLDITGRWIGVTTSIYKRVYGAEGIAFAIPTDRVRRLVGAALKSRVAVGAWLGLDEVEGADGAPTVKAVFPRGPAAASPLREGDTILSVNGRSTPTPYDYALALLDVPLGSALKLGVRRGDKELPPVTLPFEAIPTQRPGARSARARGGRRRRLRGGGGRACGRGPRRQGGHPGGRRDRGPGLVAHPAHRRPAALPAVREGRRPGRGLRAAPRPRWGQAGRARAQRSADRELTGRGPGAPCPPRPPELLSGWSPAWCPGCRRPSRRWSRCRSRARARSARARAAS